MLNALMRCVSSLFLGSNGFSAKLCASHRFWLLRFVSLVCPGSEWSVAGTQRFSCSLILRLSYGLSCSRPIVSFGNIARHSSRLAGVPAQSKSALCLTGTVGCYSSLSSWPGRFER